MSGHNDKTQPANAFVAPPMHPLDPEDGGNAIGGWRWPRDGDWEEFTEDAPGLFNTLMTKIKEWGETNQATRTIVDVIFGYKVNDNKQYVRNARILSIPKS